MWKIRYKIVWLECYLNYFSSFYPKKRICNLKKLLNKVELRKDFIKKPVSSYSKGMKQRTSNTQKYITIMYVFNILCLQELYRYAHAIPSIAFLRKIR